LIEKVYYELSLEQKFKKTNVRFKLKQYLKIAQKYFDQYQPFKMSEIETKERKKIESKVLGRYLEEDEYNYCKFIFEDERIIFGYIKQTLIDLDEKENETNKFASLNPKNQNRLLIYLYYLRRSAEEKIDSKWMLPYLKFIIDNDLDTQDIPNIYYSFSLKKLKDVLIKKGIAHDILEE